MAKPTGADRHHRRQGARLAPCSQMVVGVLIAIFLVGYSADAAAAAVQQARSFCWRAALDQKTGEATATEISTPRRRSNRAGAQQRCAWPFQTPQRWEGES